MIKQAVILAGGKGTRLGKLTLRVPKPMVEIAGRPVLQHQIEFLKKSGIRKIWVLTGYLSEVIENFCSSGKWGIEVVCVKTPENFSNSQRLLGLRKTLKEDFFLIYGDVVVNFDFRRLESFHLKGDKKLVTLIAHPNGHPFDSDLLEADSGGKLLGFFPKPHKKGSFHSNLVNAGAYVVSPRIFDWLDKKFEWDFANKFLPWLLKKQGALYSYRSSEYFKDMGTPERLSEVRRDFQKGKIERMSLKHPRPAVFLDRDGVINEEVDQLKEIKQLRVYDFAGPAIRRFHQLGFLVILVTNQPQIARGYITEKYLSLIHKKLETSLGEENAFLDGIYFCPHHPLDRFMPKGLPAYAINCACRKPKTGMLRQAVKDFNVDLKKSFMVGDSNRDAKTAENFGIKFYGVKTGYGCKDRNFGNKKQYKLYKNLLAVAKSLK
jgi:D,D-heptose 1,7-bisphosphate phosphatase